MVRADAGNNKYCPVEASATITKGRNPCSRRNRSMCHAMAVMKGFLIVGGYRTIPGDFNGVKPLCVAVTSARAWGAEF